LEDAVETVNTAAPPGIGSLDEPRMPEAAILFRPICGCRQKASAKRAPEKPKPAPAHARNVSVMSGNLSVPVLSGLMPRMFMD
jgi:hypothetical protein